MPPESSSIVGTAEMTTLKRLALAGALKKPITMTTAELATAVREEISSQTASRRVRRLDEAGFITRQIGSNGQKIGITEEGRRRLEQEYQEYCQIFSENNQLVLEGDVTTGMGEGSYYINLSGYAKQFKDRLGYRPYPGTLNLNLTTESIRQRGRLQFFEAVHIESWSGEDRTYGAANCYSATITTDEEETYEQAHILLPDRTHHDTDQLEIIAPDRLRDELGLSDGDHVSVQITRGDS